jgi:hypothetical protein
MAEILSDRLIVILTEFFMLITKTLNLFRCVSENELATELDKYL